MDPQLAGFDPKRLQYWHWLVGTGFSLWRAVFLVLEADEEGRDAQHVGKNAEQFLLKVIRANSITFGDDVVTHAWSSGYYLNNARYRVKRLLSELGLGDPLPEDIANASLRAVWSETFSAAQTVVQHLWPSAGEP
jgi:hypothetical protein